MSETSDGETFEFRPVVKLTPKEYCERSGAVAVAQEMGGSNLAFSSVPRKVEVDGVRCTWLSDDGQGIMFIHPRVVEIDWIGFGESWEDLCYVNDQWAEANAKMPKGCRWDGKIEAFEEGREYFWLGSNSIWFQSYSQKDGRPPYKRSVYCSRLKAVPVTDEHRGRKVRVWMDDYPEGYIRTLLCVDADGLYWAYNKMGEPADRWDNAELVEEDGS